MDGIKEVYLQEATPQYWVRNQQKEVRITNTLHFIRGALWSWVSDLGEGPLAWLVMVPLRRCCEPGSGSFEKKLETRSKYCYRNEKMLVSWGWKTEIQNMEGAVPFPSFRLPVSYYTHCWQNLIRELTKKIRNCWALASHHTGWIWSWETRA